MLLPPTRPLPALEQRPLAVRPCRASSASVLGGEVFSGAGSPSAFGRSPAPSLPPSAPLASAPLASELDALANLVAASAASPAARKRLDLR